MRDIINLIEGAQLPMDKAAREQRAKALGFDISKTLYHGTGAAFASFKKSFHGVTMGTQNREPFAVWLTSSPVVAGVYADEASTDKENPWDGTTRKGTGSPSIMPLFARSADFRVIDCRDMNHYQLLRNKGWELKMAKKYKEPGIIFRNAEDGTDTRSDIYAIFNPARVRSIYAAFDPARKNSSDLLS